MKGGFRNLLGFLDKWTVEYDKSLNKTSNSLNCNVNFPIFYGDSNLDIGYSINKRQLLENYKTKAFENVENY